MTCNRRVFYALFAWTLLTGAILAFAAPVDASINSPEDESRIRAFIARGKEFYRIKDFQSAIKTWVKVLDIDPLHEEAMELIDDAKFQSDYQVAVLDKLEQDRRLKKPYADELSKMASEMSSLLKRAEEERGARNSTKLSAVTKQEVTHHLKEHAAAIQDTFDQGLRLFLAGMKKEAYVEWDKILPLLPKNDDLAIRIRELKEDAHTIPQVVPLSTKTPSVTVVAPAAPALPAATVSSAGFPVAPAVPAVPRSKTQPALPSVKAESARLAVPPPAKVVQNAVAAPPAAPKKTTAVANSAPKKIKGQLAAETKRRPTAPVAAATSVRSTATAGSTVFGWILGILAVGLLVVAAFWIAAHGSRGKRSAANKRLAVPKKAPMREDTPANKEQFDPKALGGLLKPTGRGERDLLQP